MATATLVCTICAKRKPFNDKYFSSYTTASGNPSRRRQCKVCMSARAKRHHDERPDLRKKNLENRRKRLLNAVGSHVKEDVEKIRKRLRDRCFYCGEDASGRKGTVDHMVPLVKGGTNFPNNLTLACRTCNFDKHSKTADAFVRWRVLHAKPCTARARSLLKK